MSPSLSQCPSVPLPTLSHPLYLSLLFMSGLFTVVPAQLVAVPTLSLSFSYHDISGVACTCPGPPGVQ